jgi:hypothetical protein
MLDSHFGIVTEAYLIAAKSHCTASRRSCKNMKRYQTTPHDQLLNEKDQTGLLKSSAICRLRTVIHLCRM